MSEILKVKKPFFVMEPGDTMELTGDGTYMSVYTSDYTSANDKDDEISSHYQSVYEISKSMAEQLIEDGYLENTSKKGDFVNVFDEIDKMISTYEKELSTLNKDYADQPACLKVEKETVLSNMLKVLSHLNSLKK